MATIDQSQHPSQHPSPHPSQQPVLRHQRDEEGAVSAEYAVVTAAGVGLGGILIKLITSDWGQALLKRILEFFLAQVGLA